MIKISLTKLMLVFLLVNPFIEIIYAVFVLGTASAALNITRILRGIALVIMLFDLRNRKTLLKVAGIIALFILLFFGTTLTGLQVSLGVDFGFTLKILMGIVSYYYFYEKLRTNRLSEKTLINIFSYTVCIVGGIILLSYFGLGKQTYGNERFGFKGFFAAANMPTAYLLMLLPMVMLCDSKWKWLPFILACAALVTIGTKTGVLGLALVLFIIGCAYVKKRIKPRTFFILLCGSGVGIVGVGLIITKYLPYLENLFVSNAYYHNSLMAFILSNRDSQLEVVRTYVAQLQGSRETLVILFGMGYSMVERILTNTYGNYHTVEMDFHSIFYSCGAIVLVFVSYRILSILLLGAKNWLRFRQREDFFLLLALGIGVVHAFLGGHVLTDSLNVFPIYIIMAIISVRRVRNLRKSSKNRLVEEGN